jgi:hypothetical protein
VSHETSRKLRGQLTPSFGLSCRGRSKRRMKHELSLATDGGNELREDGGNELREDGGYEVRE